MHGDVVFELDPRCKLLWYRTCFATTFRGGFSMTIHNSVRALFSWSSLTVLLSIQAVAQAPATPVGKSVKASGAAIAPAAQSGVDRGIPDKFIIGEGDVLQISVW